MNHAVLQPIISYLLEKTKKKKKIIKTIHILTYKGILNTVKIKENE